MLTCACSAVFLKKFNIAVHFVTTSDPADFAAAIDDKTKAIYVESIGNPKYIVPDIPAISKVRRCGVRARIN